MPHINRVRVNNVKYNFGTQYYDDFIMRFSGKNTIYDLANGGGKSVLMMLLIQNMLPNSTLDEKQPIEKLFREGNGNQTIHSLIEWKLNPVNVENGFQFMCTGFCARKGRDSFQQEEETRGISSVEYFNYCILYREFNDNDLRNLPLNNGKERITYTGLRTYLRDLDKNDFNLQIKIFDRKGDYQRFISNYGIYESEWEIICGINKTEGHVRTYFETTYRTTRKVVEDLLIEEIIQKSFASKANTNQNDSEIAQTLLDIKDKLIDLSKKKSELSNYDSQIELIHSFIQRIGILKGTYLEKDKIKKQLAKAYATCLSRTKQRTGRQHFLMERREAQLKETKSLNHQVETAHVLLAQRDLKQEVQHLAEILLELCEKQEQYDKSEKDIKIKETANHYFDYLENKAKYESSKVAVEALNEKNEDLLTDLRRMAAQMKQYLEQKLLDAKKELEEYEYQKKQLLSADDKLLLNERELDLRRAVKENQLDIRLKENEKLEKQLEELRKNTNLLILDTVDVEIKKNRDYRIKTATSLREVQLKQREILQQELEVKVRLAGEQEKEKLSGEQLGVIREFLSEYREKKEKVDKIKEIYTVKTYESLCEAIMRRYTVTVEKSLDLKNFIQAKQSYIAALEKGNQVELTPDILSLKEYILRYHKGSVLLGQEYIQKLEKKEKRELLERYPYLPYSLLLDDCFEDVAMDMNLREKDFGSSLIPLLSLEAIEKGKEILDEKSLTFNLKNTAIFMNEEKVQDKIMNLAKEVENLQTKLKRLQENAGIMEKDLQFVQSFLLQYENIYEEKQREYNLRKAEAKQLEGAGSQTLEELTQIRSTLAELEKAENQTLERAGILEEEALYLKEIKESYKNLTTGEKQAFLLKEEVEKIKQNHASVRMELSQSGENLDKISSQITRLRLAKDDIESQWKEIYSPYYQKDTLPTIWYNEEFLATLFKGKKAAFEQKNTDVTDKRNLADSYKAAMNKNEQAILYSGISLNELANLDDKHLLTVTTTEDLLKLKQNLTSLKTVINEITKKRDSQTERKNQMIGGIDQSRKLVQNKYGQMANLTIAGEKLSLFISESEQVLKQNKDNLKKEEIEAKDLEKQLFALESMKNDMERMMRQEEIEPDELPADGLESEVSLRAAYEKLKDTFENIKSEEAKRRESFERDKTKLTDTLRLIGAYELASEIRKSVVSPNSSQEIEIQIANLLKTIEYIELEKSRIGQGIEDMERIKGNFESQCLQSCINIKTQLDRLPKLSKITMDDKVVPIVTLSIPYIKEELYKEAMSGYINDIITNADLFKEEGDRLKYIRNQLSWKRLFSVIVSDMDSIKLNLYKRERIKEQSRYLKYEEAVGSTGQSQGIYIQFLVAIINYISSINASNANPMELKKVLFIDNPFGAAKDVYIWEPIFKLLKANNVQLIVPARGATPAITGRFEVNYILGQKMIGGKQQTVVVDYRSQTEAEDMEYIPLDSSQIAFDFIDINR